VRFNTPPHLFILGFSRSYKEDWPTQLYGQFLSKRTFTTAGATNYQDVYRPHPLGYLLVNIFT
jgi:hypothetical protein